MATLKCKVGFQVQPHVGQLTAQYKGRTIFGKGKVIIKCHAGQKWWVDMRLFLFVRLISSRQVLSCSYRVDRSRISFIKCFKFNLKINPSVPHTYINHGHNPYICTIKWKTFSYICTKKNWRAVTINKKLYICPSKLVHMPGEICTFTFSQRQLNKGIMVVVHILPSLCTW